MSKTIQRTLTALGLTPWQVATIIACGAFYIGEMRPKLAAGGEVAAELKDLNKTVQNLTTKVEVHSVLLASMTEMRAEVRELRDQVSKLHSPKTASAN